MSQQKPWENKKKVDNGSKNNQYDKKNTWQNQKPEPPEFQSLNHENYVDIAEKTIKVIQKLGGKNIVSTNQLRNILAMSNDICMELQAQHGDEIPEDIKGRINYLKVRMIYDAGRFEAVKHFVDYSHLIEHIQAIGDSKSKYLLFCRYIESLVAYRKYIIGNDEK